MIVCPRCKRGAVGWPLKRPDVCSPKDWVSCIRDPETILKKEAKMPKKTVRKKKAFKAACRDKAMHGMMNTADGGFKPFSQCQDNAMLEHYKGGYKVPS